MTTVRSEKATRKGRQTDTHRSGLHGAKHFDDERKLGVVEALLPLDPGVRLRGRIPAQLAVELGQHGSTVHRDIPSPGTRAGQSISGTR